MQLDWGEKKRVDRMWCLSLCVTALSPRGDDVERKEKRECDMVDEEMEGE